MLRKPKVSLRRQCRGGDALEHSFAGPFFSLIALFLSSASNTLLECRPPSPSVVEVYA